MKQHHRSGWSQWRWVWEGEIYHCEPWQAHILLFIGIFRRVFILYLIKCLKYNFFQPLGPWIRELPTIWPTHQMSFPHNLCPSSRKIAITEGSLTIVPCVGNVKVRPLLILKMFFMSPDCPQTWCLSKSLLNMYIPKKFFIIIIVHFMKKTWGGWLDMLENRMDPTTLKTDWNHQIDQILWRVNYLILLSLVHWTRREFGFTIADLNIHHLGLL